jgi:hypothetical protein
VASNREKLLEALNRSMRNELQRYRNSASDPADHRSVGIDPRLIERAASKAKVSDLEIADLARIINDQIRESRREVLAHVARVVALLEVKFGERPENERARNFHRRISALESALRQMQGRR